MKKQYMCFVDLKKALDRVPRKVMVSSIITKDGLSKSNLDPCGVLSLKVKANSALYVQCGKIRGYCAREKRLKMQKM